jgi:hypothetical protein
VVDIFDEVDEDLRAERAQRLARKYGWAVIAAAVLVIAGVAGWEYHQRSQAQQDAAVAARYIAAIDAAQQAPAVNPEARAAQVAPLQELTRSAPDGYRTLADLKAAGLLADAGNIQGAVDLYNQVAADQKADPLLRDLASLLAAQRQLDNGDPAQLAARLGPLALPGNPWAALAKEQLAMLDLRQGHNDDAKAKLKALASDILAPAGVRARANALLQGLG